MIKMIKYFSPIILLLLLTACADKNRSGLKTQSAGAPGDLLVVMNKGHWESAPGDTLINILTSPVEGLPSVEPLFDVIHVPHSSFNRNFMAQRNIIVTKIGADQQESKITIQNDPYARNQLVMTISAPGKEEFIALIDSNRYKIVAVINNAERKRMASAFKHSLDPEITEVLRNKVNISLTVPAAYELDQEEENFLWLAHEYRDIIQGIFVYWYDYSDPNTFTRDFLVAKRNEVLKKYVPGEIPGSFMTTEPLYPPVFYQYEMNDAYTVEMRGLWRMEGGLAMGGPFVSITQLDESRNRVITVEGFVFAPAYEKREYLRQVEAIAHSLEILPVRE